MSGTVPQLERCSKGGKILFWGGGFGVGLLFSEFSVGLKKKFFGFFSPRKLVLLYK